MRRKGNRAKTVPVVIVLLVFILIGFGLMLLSLISMDTSFMNLALGLQAFNALVFIILTIFNDSNNDDGNKDKKAVKRNKRSISSYLD